MGHPLRGSAGAPLPGPRTDALAADGPQWPTFSGTATLVGTSPGGVAIYCDAALGAEALANATHLLASADGVVARNAAIFGRLTDPPVSVVVFAIGGATDGTGGADHAACDFASGRFIEVCASYGRDDRVVALLEAELSECCMGGNLCGVATGEALSRWCSMVIAPGALSDFASAPTWDVDGRPNFVDSLDPTDQNYDSIGCGMAFVSWLMGGTIGRYTLPQIAGALVALGAGATLAQLYERLSGHATSAWSEFSAALPAKITSDDPFGALGGATQPAGGQTMGAATVEMGRELDLSFVVLDQHGQPMSATPDAPPSWTGSTPATETLTVAADGLTAVATPVAPGTDSVGLSVVVGGATLSDTLAVTVTPAAPVPTSVKIAAVVK